MNTSPEYMQKTPVSVANAGNMYLPFLPGIEYSSENLIDIYNSIHHHDLPFHWLSNQYVELVTPSYSTMG